MDSLSLDFVLNVLKEGNIWTFILGMVIFGIYKKRIEIYDTFMVLIRRKIMITNKELEEHTFFTTLKHNTLNNTFGRLNENTTKTDFKYYIANTLNYIIQYCYYENFKAFLEEVNKTNINVNLEDTLKFYLTKSENDVFDIIKEQFNQDLYEIYDENTSNITSFYHSLVLSIMDYDQFNKNEKIYTILNTLLFVTKTNQNSLFSTILNMNGRVESMQNTIKLPTKLDLKKKL